MTRMAVSVHCKLCCRHVVEFASDPMKGVFKIIRTTDDPNQILTEHLCTSALGQWYAGSHSKIVQNILPVVQFEMFNATLNILHEFTENKT